MTIGTIVMAKMLLILCPLTISAMPLPMHNERKCGKDEALSHAFVAHQNQQRRCNHYRNWAMP